MRLLSLPTYMLIHKERKQSAWWAVKSIFDFCPERRVLYIPSNRKSSSWNTNFDKYGAVVETHFQKCHNRITIEKSKKAIRLHKENSDNVTLYRKENQFNETGMILVFYWRDTGIILAQYWPVLIAQSTPFISLAYSQDGNLCCDIAQFM